MDKDQAKKALAQLDYDISTAKDIIAGLEQKKQAIKADISQITTSKKNRLEQWQKDINGTQNAQQKKRKRDARDRGKKSYDARINIKKKQIENFNTRIADERKKISERDKMKKAVKLDQAN
jgi:exonuclease VII large subunit